MALEDIRGIDKVEGEGPIEDMRQLESDLKAFKEKFSNEKIKQANVKEIKDAYVELQLLLEKYKSIKSQESLLLPKDKTEYEEIKKRINLGPLAFDNAFGPTTILPDDRSLESFSSKNILSAMNVLQGIPERIKKMKPLTMMQEKEKIVYDMKRVQKVFDNVRKDENYTYMFRLMDHQLVTLGDNMLYVREFMDDIKLDELKDIQERVNGYIKQIKWLEKQKKWKTESGLGYQASWVKFNRAESFVQQEGVDRLINDVFGLDVNSSNPAVKLIIDQLKAQLVDFDGDYTVFNAGPMVSQSAIKEIFKTPNLKLGGHTYQMTYWTGYEWKTALLNSKNPLKNAESYAATLLPGGGPGLFIKQLLFDASSGAKTTERSQMSFGIKTGLDFTMSNTDNTIRQTLSGRAGYKIDESFAADEKFFEDGNNLLGTIGQFLPGVENTVKDQLTRFPGKYAVFGPPAGTTRGGSYKFEVVPFPDNIPNLSLWAKAQYEHMQTKYGITANSIQMYGGLNYAFGGKKKK